MKVLNVHDRVINAPKSTLTNLLSTLSRDDDKVWPHEKWPRLRLDKGLQVGSKGGHGPIRYTVTHCDVTSRVQFTFSRPIGFDGFHMFELEEIDADRTHIRHTIDMNTSAAATVLWLTGIRWLHDALIEDGLDKIENLVNQSSIKTRWSPWVKILRSILK